MGKSCKDQIKEAVDKSARKVDNKILAIIILIFNIIAPGLGTSITACVGGDFDCNILIMGGF